MQQLTGDIWALRRKTDIVVITTNGFLKTNGQCVMGRGIAAQAAKLYPWLPTKLGMYLAKYGNRAFKFEYGIATMPVKPVSAKFTGANTVSHMRHHFAIGDTVPGWACVADLKIISKSAAQLVSMADKFNWQRILMPRPGCGAGELSWDIVRPALDGILDNRFIACTFS